ncbi:uroporphyrinogen-III synthase-like protein [Lojkania enalia]|uniref:Uroporphyrinogen-III synthase-like protein n=1 Tax=Lojkania enalia TaxID=147567 RepID=A0A9P4JZV8_9PLEO|nr:uroporphyrinogen-III synthase-like protein [Didymosphaeria enalia]
MATASRTTTSIPVLLLKTRSVPADGYEELFSTLDDGTYDPVFVPVLEHRFKQAALNQVRRCITSGGFAPDPEQGLAKYGAIIFTSQRAVEALAEIVGDIKRDGIHSLDELLPSTLPFYVVGPATARGLRALNLPCPILGEETGNGEVLSTFIMEHYNGLYPGTTKPPILFLVGEKRRDIIPRTLQSDDLPPGKKSQVDEIVIYETGEMLSFKTNFSSVWQKKKRSQPSCQWVVVFSPTGCKAMLESLNFLDLGTGKVRSDIASSSIFVATIGPTTRDYLINEFGFTPDVCAEKPSPEGIVQAIQAYRRPST